MTSLALTCKPAWRHLSGKCSITHLLLPYRVLFYPCMMSGNICKLPTEGFLAFATLTLCSRPNAISVPGPVCFWPTRSVGVDLDAAGSVDGVRYELRWLTHQRAMKSLLIMHWIYKFFKILHRPCVDTLCILVSFNVLVLLIDQRYPDTQSRRLLGKGAG